MKKCLEIVSSKDEVVKKRFDLTGKTQEEIDKIYETKGKKLAQANFMRVIQVPLDFDAEKIK